MAKIETLQDDFNDGIFDTAKWQTSMFDGSFNETTQLNINLDAISPSYGGYFGLSVVGGTPYDLSNSHIYFEILDNGGTDVKTNIKILSNFFSDVGGFIWDRIYTTIDGGNIRFYIQSYVGFDDFEVFSYTTPYSAINHKIIRIRESAGTIYFDVSADGLTYTTLGSYAHSFDLTVMLFSLDCENFGVTPETVQLRYLNHDYTPIVVPPNPCVKLRGKCKIRGKVQLR